MRNSSSPKLPFNMAERITIQRTTLGLLIMAEFPGTPGHSFPFFERARAAAPSELHFRVVFARRGVPENGARTFAEACELQLAGLYDAALKFRITLPSGKQMLIGVPAKLARV